jgi:hypothetical protein
MNSPQRRLLFVVLPLASLACAGRPASSSAPTVTSAPVEPDAEARAKADAVRLRTERDEARSQAATERQRCGFERLLQDERNNFAKRAWTKLDDIDASIRALRAKTKEKPSLDDAQSRREQIDHALRGVFTEPEDGLERLETEIDARIDELSALVSGARR